MRAVCGLCLIILLLGVEASAQKKFTNKKAVYEEVDLEQMIRRYFGKDVAAFNSIEGIYAVSCVITRTGNNFLTGQPVTKVVSRRDNYARVAIMKDWPGSKREYIEVSMSYHQTNKYPIVGEFGVMLEGGGYFYTHTEPDGSRMNFTMIYDNAEMIEGRYSYSQRRRVITFQLTYMKIFPKAHELNVVR
jgi:hypothetical protein